jgi:predicted ATP-dependent endonuclease of OLD family
MKLKSFELKSYRSCLKTNLNLNNELTGLIGINGAGKSNILNGILLLKKICFSRYAPFREAESSYNSCHINCEISYEQKIIYLKGEIIFETDERNYDEILKSKLKWNLKDFTGNSEWLEIPIEMLGLNYKHQLNFMIEPSNPFYKGLNKKDWEKIAKLQSSLTEKIIPLLSTVLNFFNGISYYSASQFSDPSRCPVSIEIEENRPMRKPRSMMGHDQFILDLYKSFKINGQEFKRYISAVNKMGIGLIDDICFTEVEMPSNSYEVQSGGKIKKIERNRLLIVPSISIDGKNLSPNQLSEGTFKTLALLFYVLTDNSKLLLIEEPEVCIHHGLLNSIISLIKAQSKLKQIIISTHSDYVLDHLTPENLVLVKRDEKGTVAKDLTRSMSKNDYKALKSYLNESGNLGEYWREGGFDNE